MSRENDPSGIARIAMPSLKQGRPGRGDFDRGRKIFRDFRMALDEPADRTAARSPPLFRFAGAAAPARRRRQEPIAAFRR
jgi:hypothetical protein